MPFADVNAVRLYYEEQGAGEPLICVMGLATSSSAWVLQVPAFAARHRTVTFDNRDVGQSSRMDAPYGIGDMAADVLALADHLEIDEFHLLGVSMGGAIAQHVAVRAPERVRTLTLCVTLGGRRRLRGREDEAVGPRGRALHARGVHRQPDARSTSPRRSTRTPRASRSCAR